MIAEPIPKASPRWQGLALTGKLLDNGDMEPGKPLIVNCHSRCNNDKCACLHDTTTERWYSGPYCVQCAHQSCKLIRPIYMCANCAEDFVRVLADIPELLDDLDIAIAGEAKFIEHGTIQGSIESPGPSRHPAVAAHHRLCLALLGDGTAAHPGCAQWFDARDPVQLGRLFGKYLHRLVTDQRLPQLARDISGAAARAHHVIDAPRDLVPYGPCPDCGNWIIQERIHRDDQETKVQCRLPSCNYAEPLDVHYRKIIDSNLDRHFSITDCVSMITKAGQPVTRDQINGWIRHKGFPREWTERPTWKDNDSDDIVMKGMWTVKLRDVLEFMNKKQEKTAS